MRVIAISAKGEDTIEFKSLHEASKWAGLPGAADIKRLIDTGAEWRGAFFDWADERTSAKEKKIIVAEKKDFERTDSDGNCVVKKGGASAKWADPEYKKQWQHEWYLKNKEYMREYSKRYKTEHMEEILQYRKDNADKLRAQKKAWREKNAEKIKAYNREYFKKRQAAKRKAEDENYSRE